MRALLLLIGLGVMGCGAAEQAAQKDPMKCERDPKCEQKRSKSQDCSSQCNDDPACMERCEAVQRSNGPIGH